MPSSASPALRQAYKLTRDLYTQFLALTHDCDLSIFGHLEEGSRESPGRSAGQWSLCKPLSPNQRALGNFKPACSAITSGVSSDWSFEGDLAALGCMVYGYYPRIDIAQRPNRFPEHFLPIAAYIGMSDATVEGRPAMAIASIMTSHSLATVDVLKLDLDYTEFAVLGAAIADGSIRRVKQLAFEVHFDEVVNPTTPTEHSAHIVLTTFPGYLNFLQSLKNQGFVAVDWHQTAGCAPCKELLWVNTRFAGELGLQSRATVPTLEL